MTDIEFPPEYCLSDERLRRMNLAIEALMGEASQHTASLPEPLAQQIQLTYQSWDEVRTEINDQRCAYSNRRLGQDLPIAQPSGDSRHGK